MPANRYLLGLLAAGLIAGCTSTEAIESTTSTTGSSAEVAGLEETIVKLDAEVAELRSQVAELEQSLQDTRREARRLKDQEAELRGALEAALAASQAERARWEKDLAQLRDLAPLPDTPEARKALFALEGFLAAMRTGDYATAAGLYAGSLESVVDWNPEVDSSDRVALLEAACQQLLCDLHIRRVLPGLVIDDGREFWVEFETSAGELFTRGPCCGDDSGSAPETQFLFTVVAQDGESRVTTLPVYVP